MSQASRKPRPPNATRRANAAERPNQYREKLLQVGTRLCLERGIARVSVEQLVAAAGVSRATFYGFFANKNELAAAILAPVFKSGSDALAELHDLPPQSAAEALIDVYLELWRNHQAALLLIDNFDAAVFPYIKSEHDAFNAALENVLHNIGKCGLLKSDSPEITLRILAKTAIPLLRVYKDCEELDQLYRDSMLGLITKS